MTDRNNGANTDARNPDGTFAAGNAGRPRGARHRTTVAVEALLDGQAEALTKKAIELALNGDNAALRLCLERVAPARKDSSIAFDMPAVRTSADAVDAARAIVESVAAGEITPSEGAAAMALVDSFRRTLEVSEIEQRLAALEALR